MCRPQNAREGGLLTTHQAANVLAISNRKLWTMTNRGEVRHVRIGRNVRYDIDDLHEWIEANKKGGQASG